MKQYEMLELTFEGSEPAGNQAQVDVRGEFYCEATGQSVCVKGFYAGGGRYKVRFLPETASDYTWTVTGLVQGQGSFTAEPCEEKGSADHGHGIVRADGTHFRYADGNWFYPFGTTVYALAHQEDALLDETVETLAHSPFNKVRMCVFPKHYHYNHNEPRFYPFAKREDGSWDPAHPCFAFWDDFENTMKRLMDLDIQVDLILFHPYDRWGFSSMTQLDNLIYLDYLLRRFAAYSGVWWSLANEYDLCRGKSRQDWYEIEEFVADNDPFHHLESNHNCLGYWDAERLNVTHESLQIKTLAFLDREMKKNGKPICVDECRYEGNIEESWGNLSGKAMTQRFWEALTQGAYCTHGETFLDRSVANPDDAVLWWSKGGKLKGESPTRIQFLKDLAESFPGPMSHSTLGGIAGLDELMDMSEEEFKKYMEEVPTQFRCFSESMRRLDPLQRERKDAGEHHYTGQVGEDVLLYYFDTQCLARASITLPENQRYRVEIIDTWNMTRETVVENVSGNILVTMPGREYMAVLATKMPEEVRMIG
jgi:hypothetical protein